MKTQYCQCFVDTIYINFFKPVQGVNKIHLAICRCFCRMFIMPDKTTPKQNRVFLRCVCGLLAAVVLLFTSQGTVEASIMPHSHKAVTAFSSNEKVENHSCPLPHHPKIEVCPLSHQSISLDVVAIKNCGGTPAEGGIPVTGYSKVSVAPNGFDDFRLPLVSQSPSMVLSFYSPLHADPLDHPPRSI